MTTFTPYGKAIPEGKKLPPKNLARMMAEGHPHCWPARLRPRATARSGGPGDPPPGHRGGTGRLALRYFDLARGTLDEAGWGLDELPTAAVPGPAQDNLFSLLGLARPLTGYPYQLSLPLAPYRFVWRNEPTLAPPRVPRRARRHRPPARYAWYARRVCSVCRRGRGPTERPDPARHRKALETLACGLRMQYP